LLCLPSHELRVKIQSHDAKLSVIEFFAVAICVLYLAIHLSRAVCTIQAGSNDTTLQGVDQLGQVPIWLSKTYYITVLSIQTFLADAVAKTA
jgi:hypothetical protein